ncbi:MAG: TauD/TfdA family dioxygenase [Nostoc sp.]|uniref:TauD/TfdA family dioxygenase n=1 Tax=Nostoc sp. TaxID=1180 RepID=UPI002FF92D35
MTKMINLTTFGTTDAKIIFSDQSENILSLPTQEILDLFNSFGLLLFRGFGVNYEQMVEFSGKFSSKYVRDPQRQIVDSPDKFIQLVDNGTDYVPPHCENAVSPFRPDVVWFCCAVPAAENGETLFWDGVQVWKELSEQSKKLFLSKKIKFMFDFDVDSWKLFFGSDTTIDDAKRSLSELEGINYFIRDDQSIHMEYICSSVVKTRTSGKEAFANSIIPWYQKQGTWEKIKSSLLDTYSSSAFGKFFGSLPQFLVTYLQAKPQTVTFEDGSPITDVVIDEINTIMNRLTGVISWQTGDIVMIDNSRFLHGRRAFKDTRRQIFSHLSYLKP